MRAAGFFCVLVFTPLLILAAMPARAADDAEILRDARRLGSQIQFNEAAAALPASASGESARFTRAVLLYNQQPRTAARIAEACALLDELTRAGSTSAVRARSLYYLARFEDLKPAGRNASAVAHLYERLRLEYPGNPYAERALIHQFMLAIHGDEPREVILARCAALDAQAEHLSDHVVRSQFHQVAGRGYLVLGGADDRALRHLIAAEELGVARPEARGDLQVSIGRLAAEQGRPEVARQRFEAFLRDFPRDARAYTVRELLKALPNPISP